MTISESDASLKAIEAVERRVLPAVLIKGSRETSTLEEALAQHNVPAVSIAVISGGRLQWARAYGAAHAGGEPVNTRTLFQSCSISKTIATVTALRLVDQRLLDLDRDVNELLTSWRVPDNPYTKGNPVTTRHLLSHRAGVNVGGFPGYEPDGPIPTLGQILRGEPPCNTEALRVDAEPGRAFRYSGGGMQILQQLLEDVSGIPYAKLATREVLNPAGMTRSTFEPSPTGVAAGHDLSGQIMVRSFAILPELAAAGLWSTPSDLARFAVAVQDSYAEG
ncbi:MAG TPA: serine hydrolase domain-containing protein, partial [Dehalococcoidia bacterium]|nr:serine hydrolase domain-containing protein [Dehalococcoidia bacterium]